MKSLRSLPYPPPLTNWQVSNYVWNLTSPVLGSSWCFRPAISAFQLLFPPWVLKVLLFKYNSKVNQIFEGCLYIDSVAPLFQEFSFQFLVIFVNPKFYRPRVQLSIWVLATLPCAYGGITPSEEKPHNGGSHPPFMSFLYFKSDFKQLFLRILFSTHKSSSI